MRTLAVAAVAGRAASAVERRAASGVEGRAASGVEGRAASAGEGRAASAVAGLAPSAVEAGTMKRTGYHLRMVRALQAGLVAGAIGMLIGAAALQARPRSAPNEQLVVVVADTWTSTVGELRRFT